MVDTKVNLCGWVLDNPVIATSGTFGYGKEFSKFYDINMLGTFSFKGTTVEPRFGNPLPRIADCDSGMLLSIGLQNNGIDHVIAHELPEMKQYFHKKVIANCAGFCVDDYVTLAKKLDDQEQVGIIELNVSCPNVGAGGTAIGTDCVNLEKTVREVKKVTSKTVFVKLTPAVTDIVSIAKSAENGGADGISMINTLTGMRINLKTRKSIIQNIAAGYSGPALFPAGAQHDLQGLRRGKNTHYRHRRSYERRTRRRNDDGGRNRGGRGFGKPRQSIRVQGNNRGLAASNAKIRYRKAVRHHRRGSQIDEYFAFAPIFYRK